MQENFLCFKTHIFVLSANTVLAEQFPQILLQEGKNMEQNNQNKQNNQNNQNKQNNQNNQNKQNNQNNQNKQNF